MNFGIDSVKKQLRVNNSEELTFLEMFAFSWEIPDSGNGFRKQIPEGSCLGQGSLPSSLESHPVGRRALKAAI